MVRRRQEEGLHVGAAPCEIRAELWRKNDAKQFTRFWFVHMHPARSGTEDMTRRCNLEPIGRTRLAAGLLCENFAAAQAAIFGTGEFAYMHLGSIGNQKHRLVHTESQSIGLNEVFCEER